MIRGIVIGAVCCLVGCGASSGTSFSKYDLSGRYVVEIENTEGGATLVSSLEGSIGPGAKTAVQEQFEVTWGNSTHRLLIENGMLIVDGVEYGALKVGDRITVTAAGDLLINGSRPRS